VLVSAMRKIAAGWGDSGRFHFNLYHLQNLLMDALLLGVFGTSFSALIAALGYLIKLVRDRKRTTRLVLYYLLEFHHRLSAVVYLIDRFPVNFLAEVTRSLGKKGLTLSDTDRSEISEVLRKKFQSWAAKYLDDLSREVVAPYEAALLELAKDDPVLAFMLKGQESPSGPAKIMSELMEPLPTDIDLKVRDAFLSRLEGNTWKEMLTNMERSIKSVALRCSCLTRLYVGQIFDRQKKSRQKIISSDEVSRFVDETIQAAIAAGKGTV
jgi:hypothetical protein